VQQHHITVSKRTGQGFADNDGLVRAVGNHLQRGHSYDRFGRVAARFSRQ
jgi:hypothetical protein